MKRPKSSYRGHRFPSEIISHAVWLYHRFGLSFRDVEDLLAERGVEVSHESIRQWCLKFGPEFARRLKRKEGRLGDHWHLDEVFVTIQGRLHYLWRVCDQDGDTIDILQQRRDRRAAKRFFRRLIEHQGCEPSRVVSDKLGSYAAARRVVMSDVPHDMAPYANNRAELSHQPTRLRERIMRKFKSPPQAQRFLTLHGLVGNLFRLGRHLKRAVNYRLLRARSFATWQEVAVV